MYFIKSLPPGVEIPPIEDFVCSRPTSWQGLPVKWLTNTATMPVFVHQFAVWCSGTWIEALLFGARYDLREAEVAGASLGGGHFVEYIVASRREKSEWRFCHLLQHASPTFSDGSQKGDYVHARDVSDPGSLSAARLPQWRTSEAIWPTIDGKPMMFIGQVELPDTPITREHLTWNASLYLFWARIADVDRFKVVEQTFGQSAEDFYATK
jgi:hypothetical protein